jgi:hypothetical protein
MADNFFIDGQKSLLKSSSPYVRLPCPYLAPRRSLLNTSLFGSLNRGGDHRPKIGRRSFALRA